jgi:hypothetical protein
VGARERLSLHHAYLNHYQDRVPHLLLRPLLREASTLMAHYFDALKAESP